MPTLPTVELRGQVARQRGVEIQPGPGAAIGQALQQFGGVLEKMHQVDQTLEISNQDRKLSEALLQVESDLLTEGLGPDEITAEWKTRSGAVVAAHLGDIKDGFVRQSVERLSNQTLLTSFGRVIRQSSATWRQERRAEFANELSENIKSLAGLDPNGDEYKLGRAKIDGMIKSLDHAGFFNPEERQALEEGTEKRIVQERMAFLERTDPDGLIDRVNSGEFAEVSTSERNESKNRALTNKRRAEAEREAARKEAQDEENVRLLGLLNAGSGGVDWSRDIQNNGKLDTGAKIWWHNMLQGQQGKWQAEVYSKHIGDLIKGNLSVDDVIRDLSAGSISGPQALRLASLQRTWAKGKAQAGPSKLTASHKRALSVLQGKFNRLMLVADTIKRGSEISNYNRFTASIDDVEANAAAFRDIEEELAKGVAAGGEPMEVLANIFKDKGIDVALAVAQKDEPGFFSGLLNSLFGPTAPSKSPEEMKKMIDEEIVAAGGDVNNPTHRRIARDAIVQKLAKEKSAKKSTPLNPGSGLTGAAIGGVK